MYHRDQVEDYFALLIVSPSLPPHPPHHFVYIPFEIGKLETRSAFKNCPNALPAHLVAYDDLETRP